MSRPPGTLADLLEDIRDQERLTSWEQVARYLEIPDVGTLYRWRRKNQLGPAAAERLAKLTGRPEFRRFIARKVQPVRDDERRELAQAVARIEERQEQAEAAIAELLRQQSDALAELAEAQRELLALARPAESGPASRRRKRG